MGQVDCFVVRGCECWFYSNDHPPAHFHAHSSGEWEVKVLLLRDPVETEVVYEVRRIPRRVMQELTTLASTHREALLEEWTRKVRP